MGDLQIKKQPKKYDAVIVGSGAGGGMAAYVLANAGVKVLLLEAGKFYRKNTFPKTEAETSEPDPHVRDRPGPGRRCASEDEGRASTLGST